MVGTDEVACGVRQTRLYKYVIFLSSWLFYFLLVSHFSFSVVAENIKKWSAARSSSWCLVIFLTFEVKNQAHKSPQH